MEAPFPKRKDARSAGRRNGRTGVGPPAWLFDPGMPKNAQTLSGFGSNYKTVLCRIYKCKEGDHNTLSNPLGCEEKAGE